ncbi:hypothetical protein B0J14DRAFT_556300 [Halenospora varia]|nr:hypothetical protein B0J14DRAFT_556300 [Halenospora varia]
MRREQLPITVLPSWSKLNNVSFTGVTVEDLGDSRGFGLVAEKELSSKESDEGPILLTIPHELVLSAEAVRNHAKLDRHFQELLSAAGGKTTRIDIMLFLLMQFTIASSKSEQKIGVHSPWTVYCQMLPKRIPLPTTWSDEERLMLAGTSLEAAINAKMSALNKEFEAFREQTDRLVWCYQCWWEDRSLDVSDWVFLDACYRSRCLELPNTGESMVPCIDMANHFSKFAAYYQEVSSDGVVLRLGPDVQLSASEEVTISYGQAKSESEMLFSYGFIDDTNQNMSTLALPLEPMADDPLGRAKIAAFVGKPLVEIMIDRDSVRWESPFLYFMSLNQEDGLEFMILQENDGSRSPLRVFWQDNDVTEVTDTFESLIETHDLNDIFKLRAVSLLQDRLNQQLQRLDDTEETVKSLPILVQVHQDVQKNALQLRKTETSILQKALSAVDAQKTRLLESEVVLRYLGGADEEQPEQSETNEEEDFS